MYILFYNLYSICKTCQLSQQCFLKQSFLLISRFNPGSNWNHILSLVMKSFLNLLCPLDCKEIQPVHSEGDQPWNFFGSNDAKTETPVLWPPQELTHWKRLWCWEGLGAGGGGDDRGWDGWMASLTRWTWVWVKSGSWWWTARPGVLQFMGLQRVGHDWATELNWTDCKITLDF